MGFGRNWTVLSSVSSFFFSLSDRMLYKCVVSHVCFRRFAIPYTYSILSQQAAKSSSVIPSTTSSISILHMILYCQPQSSKKGVRINTCAHVLWGSSGKLICLLCKFRYFQSCRCCFRKRTTYTLTKIFSTMLRAVGIFYRIVTRPAFATLYAEHRKDLFSRTLPKHAHTKGRKFHPLSCVMVYLPPCAVHVSDESLKLFHPLGTHSCAYTHTHAASRVGGTLWGVLIHPLTTTSLLPTNLLLGILSCYWTLPVAAKAHTLPGWATLSSDTIET